MSAQGRKRRLIRFTVRFPDEQWNGIKEMAAKQGISASELVRRSLDRTLRENVM